MKKHRRKKKTNVVTFSKRWVSILLTMSIIWISLSYVLAFFGKDHIAEELSSQVVVVIVSVTLGYLLKSYFETYSEKKNEIMYKNPGSIQKQNNNKPEENYIEIEPDNSDIVDEVTDEEIETESK